MADATVQAVAVNTSDGSNGITLGTAVTDANGAFTLAIATTPTGPVRLIASGGSFSSEQNGALISTPSPVSMLVADATRSLAGISVNPLSFFDDSQTAR